MLAVDESSTEGTSKEATAGVSDDEVIVEKVCLLTSPYSLIFLYGVMNEEHIERQ